MCLPSRHIQPLHRLDTPQDGVLSTRTLISLLKQDDVPHTLCTISGYAELEEKRVRYFGQRRGAVGEDDEDGEDDRDAVVDRRSDVSCFPLSGGVVRPKL
jgi:hypothetical protein